MTKIVNFFKKLSLVNVKEKKYILDWYHGLAHIKNIDNEEIIRRITKGNDIFVKDVISDNKILPLSFKNKVTAKQLLTFFDIYSINFQSFLYTETDMYSIKMLKNNELNKDLAHLTNFIQLSSSQLLEFLSDIYKYLDTNGTKLSLELGFASSYINKLKYNSTMAQNVLHALSLRYDLRENNFMPFIEYCEAKGWLDKKKLYSDDNFINFFDNDSTRDKLKKLSEEINKSTGLSVSSLEDYTITMLPTGTDALEDWNIREHKHVLITNAKLSPAASYGDILEFTLYDKFNGNGIYLITEKNNEDEGETLAILDHQKIQDTDSIYIVKSVEDTKACLLSELYENINILGVCSLRYRPKQ
ncbi:hypothetical protein CKF54_00975 [Psittacicella hinzii]|uniref:Uncharacterized protein n=1 Tax=Psittacicella hinzii TaxID=2028575 RepID=A0A3A1Y9I6_9GAMM|nr:hypothetical protein [Psittacicella hinzii]RIY34345.1 hypothetical protein CKF54_00975 [Psittacicella hinzii]